MKIFWANVRVTDEGILYTNSSLGGVQEPGAWEVFGKLQDIINRQRVEPNAYIQELPGSIACVNLTDNIGTVGFIAGSCCIAMLDCRDTGLFIHELDELVDSCRDVFQAVVELIRLECGADIANIHQSGCKASGKNQTFPPKDFASSGALTYHLKLPRDFWPRPTQNLHHNRTHYVCCF